MRLLLSFLMVFAVAPVCAQTFFPMQKGAVLEYKYYDARGKALRDEWRNELWTRLTVEELWGDSVANIAIDNETFTRLSKVGDGTKAIIDGVSYGDVTVKANEVVFENVLWFFMWDTLRRSDADEKSDKPGRQSFDVELSATASLPRVLHVGDSLPEVHYRSVFHEKLDAAAMAEREESNKRREEFYVQFLEYDSNFEVPKFPKTITVEITATIRNRRVEAFEKVGGYECWKISYEIVGPMERRPGVPRGITGSGMGGFEVNYGENIVPPVTKYVDYISPEVGLVRREKLNYRGKKAEESMVLESVKK